MCCYIYVWDRPLSFGGPPQFSFNSPSIHLLGDNLFFCAQIKFNSISHIVDLLLEYSCNLFGLLLWWITCATPHITSSQLLVYSASQLRAHNSATHNSATHN